MNKSALALAGFGFAVGLVLFIVVEPLMMREPSATPSPQPEAAIVAKGLTQGEQPLGGRGSDTEPKYRVDPNNGCASDDERH